MHVKEGDIQAQARKVIECPEDESGDTVRDIYEMLMDQTEKRRKNLEDRSQRLKLIRRCYEAGKKHGAREVRREFQRVLRGNGV